MRTASGTPNWTFPRLCHGLAAGWAQCLPIFLVPLEFLLSTLGHSPPATLIRHTLPLLKLTASIIRIQFSVSDNFLFVLLYHHQYWVLSLVTSPMQYAHNCSSETGNTRISLAKYYDCFIVIIHFAEWIHKLRSGSKLVPTFWHSVYWISICQGLVKITWHLHFTYILYIYTTRPYLLR